MKIKKWHLMVVVILSPYFFYWISGPRGEELGMLNFINIVMCFVIEFVCVWLIVTAGELEKLNRIGND